MPDRKCALKCNGHNLIDEKILQPAHKECYYKYILTVVHDVCNTEIS